ncbi:unnamed protein product [Aspergillus oryzae var. brunneus]|uniref:Unnamed protein product n=2 Tax=Aspergillus oryzae TaxID=5062 RepID=A0AAN4YTU0_ASPOZ|nr:unnamed protein product [Aspergillus oryzae]GMG42343.1 unnamed protein product [Aspergillus oryzae var. brunneus]
MQSLDAILGPAECESERGLVGIQKAQQQKTSQNRTINAKNLMSQQSQSTWRFRKKPGRSSSFMVLSVTL